MTNQINPSSSQNLGYSREQTTHDVETKEKHTIIVNNTNYLKNIREDLLEEETITTTIRPNVY